MLTNLSQGDKSMIKTIFINDFNDIFEIISKQKFDKNINRNRSSLIYRGLPNIDYKLETTLQRNCKHKQHTIEKSILRNFTKYAATDDPELSNSIWRQMIIGQHHGLPTRLLDWTYSPLIGLNFATSEKDLENMDQNDCVLWEIDIEEINSLLPIKYNKILKSENAYLFTVDMLNEFELEQYDSDMGNKSIILIEPPSIDQRIINQYSYFSVMPSGIMDFEDFLNKHTNNSIKYIIDKSLKWRIRDMLDQMNINERIMYPGFDGLSQWLKRHYYVK